MRFTQWLALAAVLAFIAVLSFFHLDRAPIYIGGDEAVFATQASSIARTGADLSGRRLPLFVHLTDSPESTSVRWYQPTLFYLIAAVLRARPFTEYWVRAPTAFIGVIDVLLIYLVALRYFGDRKTAILAAVLLALAPAHLIFSRVALDYICIVPFVLAWLWCLAEWEDTGQPVVAAAAGAILGVGFYSYIAAWMVMPACLVVTWIVQRVSRRRSLASAVAAGGAFAFFVVPFVIWSALHPDMLRDTIGRYHVYDARHLSPLQGARDFLNYNNIQDKISIYWDYFNPAFLFFSGGSNLTTATRNAGVFLWPTAPLLIAGAAILWRRRRPIDLVIIAGFLLGPLPAALAGERYAIQRELIILIFGVLMSAAAFSALLAHRRAAVRTVSAVLIAATCAAYVIFVRDYFGDYQHRSAFWFDPVDVRDVADRLMTAASDPGAPEVFLSGDLDDVAPRWRFALVKNGRTELLQRTHYFDPATVDASPHRVGSLFVLYANDAHVPSMIASGHYSIVTTIVHEGGSPSAVILRRSG